MVESLEHPDASARRAQSPAGGDTALDTNILSTQILTPVHLPEQASAGRKGLERFLSEQELSLASSRSEVKKEMEKLSGAAPRLLPEIPQEKMGYGARKIIDIINQRAKEGSPFANRSRNNSNLAKSWNKSEIIKPSHAQQDKSDSFFSKVSRDSS